jgi:hypothetical protein
MKFIEHKFAFAFSVAFLALAGKGDDAVGLTTIWGQISDARDTVANIRNVCGHPCDTEAWKGLGLCRLDSRFWRRCKERRKAIQGRGESGWESYASRICDGWRG